MSYLKDREIWLSNVPTGNPPAGYFWKFIQNGKVVVRDSSGNNQMMVATSGSQAITGSLTVTEGITGTVSSASYVEYSNVANKPALVSGSSQITYSGLTGIPSGIVSGSAQIASFGIFATTGSNGFNGSQSITGSLTVTGQVVAQTLNVQQVTSSIVYSSGSNVFGNSLANTQQFTGSVGITGSLTVAGAGTFTGTLNGTNAIFSGNVGIGNSSFDYPLQVLNTIGLRANSTSFQAIKGTYWGYSTSYPVVMLGNSNTSSFTTVSIGYDPSANANGAFSGDGREVLFRRGVQFVTPNAANNAFNLTNLVLLDGNVGIGTASPDVTGFGWKTLTIRGGTTSGEAGVLELQSPSTTGAANLGIIAFLDGSTRGGQIYVQRDSSTTTSNMLFATNGGSGIVERMRITSGGNVVIGNTVASNVGLTIYGTNSATIYQTPTSGTGVGNGLYVGQVSDVSYVWNYNNFPTVFATNNTERMRIASNGKVGINNSVGYNQLDVKGTSTNASTLEGIAGFYRNTTAGGALIIRATDTQADIAATWFSGATDMDLTFTTVPSSGNYFERMRITSGGNVNIGGSPSANTRLTVNGVDNTSSNFSFVANNTSANLFLVRNDGAIFTGTSGASPYNNTTASAANLHVSDNGLLFRSTSSSKYKTDIIDYTKGLNEVLGLRPVFYKGKTDGDKQFAGLIAEEVHDLGLTEFVQYAPDGSPDALSYQNMIALAVKAIQEQQTLIESLKSRIEILEQ